MNRFVDECRREWRRRGVADAVADEMAEELAADLAEAEAEGASPEDVLGDGIVDPRSFAAAWAASRGVVRSRPGMAGPRRKPSMLAAGTGLVLVVLLAGVGLVLFGPGSLVLRSHYGVGAAFGGGAPTRVVRGTSAVALHPLGWVLIVAGMFGILVVLTVSWWGGNGAWTRQFGPRPTSSGAAV